MIKNSIDLNTINIELNELFETVYSYFSSDDDIDKPLSIKTYNEFKYMLIESIKTFYPHLSFLITQLDDILDTKYYVVGINFNNIKTNIKNIDFNIEFKTCEERDEFYDTNRNNPQVIDKSVLSNAQLKLFNQYEYLINLPQPPQKSREWFEKRNNMLTASNGGAAIGESHYNTIKEVLLDKIGLGPKFKENKFVYHGKKYEKIAIMIYEIIYNTKIGEFGLIQHPSISYLGASPDGISMSLTLDGELNRLLGRMLEIKCPPSRKINNIGKIKGDICPDYYWVQVQLQLECCDLPECDFWQCHLTEPYNSEKEFLKDNLNVPVHSENQYLTQNEYTEIESEPEIITLDNRIRKGAIIELLPINRSHIPPKEPHEWYGKYIYPPTILMTGEEYIEWAKDTVKNLKTLYPELVNEYKFSRVVYWKLEKSHNELITRQPEWFEAHKKDYAKFWSRVLYYRKHLDEAKEDLIEQRLSNEVFLQTETDRIPKIKSFTQFKKSVGTNDDSSSIFIKSTGKKDSDDIFLSTSDNSAVTKPKPVSKPVSKKQKYTDELNKSKSVKNNDDIFLTSESPTKDKKIPLYKESTQIEDDDNLDLVMITENRKKKNTKKNK